MAENERPSDSGWPQDQPDGGTDPWGRPYPGYSSHPGYYGGQDPHSGYQAPGGYGTPGYGGPGYGTPPGSSGGYGTPGGYGAPGGYGPGVGTPPGGQQYPTGYPYPYGGQYPGQYPGQRQRRSPVLTAAIALLLLAIPVFAGIGIGQALQHSNNAANPSSQQTGNGNNGNATYSGNSASIAAAVDPGIVDINTTLGYQQAEAAGTGVVLTSTGEVLTNNHVINGATGISVTDIGNGRTYKASVVGYDRTDDIAVLQLQNASGLTTVQLGDSGTVGVGDSVVALGNAGGQGGTPVVATGLVTALDRSITASDESDGTSEQLSGLIEVNADVEPGDSGGPLVNGSGKVIGIDTAAATGSGNPRFQMQGQTDGRGFAIPINKAIGIAKQIERGAASTTIHIGQTAFLGVESSSGGGTGYGGGANSSGVAISGVVPGSPAASAGLTAGATISTVDGRPVDSANTLTTMLGSKHPGDKVTIGWMDANGGQHTSTVTLAAGPAQ